MSDDLSSCIEQNYITQFNYLSGIKNAVFIEDEVFTEFRSGYHTDWMNGVLKTDGNSIDLEKKIAQTLKKYDCPMLFRVGSLTKKPQLVKKILIENGFKCVANDPAMVLDQSQFHISEPIPEFTIRKVDNQELIRDWLVPFSHSFELAPDAQEHFREFMHNRVPKPKLEGWFTGYHNDEPVCSSYYLTANEVTMIYGVGTLVQFRKRGYGRRIMAATIQHALQNSSCPIALYATEMGEPLYKSMGFVEVYKLEGYART
jgi:GNAT superfamily N-acetyltransferase